MSEFCRICLLLIPDGTKSFNVYLRTADSVSIIDVMKECSSIQVTDPDELPKFVCTHCVVKLNFVYEFRNLIIGSDMRLKMQLQYNKKPVRDTTNHSLNDQLKSNVEEIEIKEETLIDTTYCENPIETYTSPNTIQNEIGQEDKSAIAITETVICDETKYNCSQSDKALNISDSEVTPFSCKICNTKFHTKRTLIMHTRTHTYSCNECEKKFRTPNDLSTHERIHKGLQKYQCSVCNKGFSYSTGFKAHMRIHTGERPFLCEICGKTFSDKCSLYGHLKIHQGKTLQCPVCGKSCNKRGLRIHMRSHTGAKPYSCTECNKKFSTSSILSMHKKAVHFGIKPHKCALCEKRFSQNGTLTKHMLTHSGEKPFSCTLCPKEFTYKHQLQSHTKKHHPEVVEVKK